MLQLSRSAKSITARGVVAASLVAAAYAVTPTSAAAGERLPADCAKAGNELAQLKCGTNHYRERRLAAEAVSVDAKARSKDAKARGVLADRQIAANRQASDTARTTKSCYDAVLGEVNAAKKLAPLTPEQITSFKARAAGCEKS